MRIRVRDSKISRNPFKICVTARPRMTEIRTEITKLVHAPNCRASVSDAKLIKRRFKDFRQQRQNDMNGHSGGRYVQRHGFYVTYSFARTISQKRMTVRNGNSSQASTDGMHQRRNSQTNMREIGRQLGVAYIMEGSVQRARDRLRINATLIDARTDAHVWAETYDRTAADLFAIQSELAQSIVTQLEAKLSPQQKAEIEERPT